MIESSINWTIGLILTSLFFYVGMPFVLLLILFDGFLGSFTKYHMGLLLAGIVYATCGVFNFILVKFCLLSFLLIKNFNQLFKKYVSGKKCLNAMLKLTRLTGIKSDELDVMEYVDSTTTYIDNKINCVNDKYSEIKNIVIQKNNEICKTELYKTIECHISECDHVIDLIICCIKNNAILFGELIYSIPFFKSYIDKGNKYLKIGNDLYSKYDKDDIFESPNLMTELKADNPINMNIDMEKLGDLAGLMTNFLDSFGDINLNLQSEMFNINQNNDLNETNLKTTDISNIDDETTLLDDEIEIINKPNQIVSDNVMSDDEINQILNRGGQIDEKYLLHAFETISNLTEKNNDAKISLKRKKND